MIQQGAKRIRLLVQGRVQGVGFRWFVISEGRRLGLKGWVRNNADGSVELEAEGTEDHVSQLHQRVSQGPSAARVQSVTQLPPTADVLPERFELMR